MNEETFFYVKHKPATDAFRLLESLKIEAVRLGLTEEEVEENRRQQRVMGRSASAIAACEFAEMRMFADLPATVEMKTDITIAPSEATMALAERDGYCPSCVRFWYGAFANAFRELLSDADYDARGNDDDERQSNR